ncbi:MAG: sugar phosphate isomerase/epimerase [Rhodobacteraceae bacterium]|nr:sugar phosphate isomerase/epimerase [Paracoccaceae bacterium]
MKGFGVHACMWTMNWDRDGAELGVRSAAGYNVDFVEIPLLDPSIVDTVHTRKLLEKYELNAVCSLGLPEGRWPSNNPEGAIAFLKIALEKSKEMGADALTGVTFGGIGERTGFPPTRAEIDNVAYAVDVIGKYAKSLGLLFGIEPVNRYETHLLNTGWQARDLIERIGNDNVFIHLDTYHMNIEEKGVVNGIIDASKYLKYIHLSESDRGTPGCGTCDWDEIFAGLAAVGFDGGMAMESFIELPPEIANGLCVWRPVANSNTEVMDEGLPFLRNKAKQYRLI